MASLVWKIRLSGLNCWLGGGNSNICYFHPYLGKISNLTKIFQRGWNHQVVNCWLFCIVFCWEVSEPRECEKIGLNNQVDISDWTLDVLDKLKWTWVFFPPRVPEVFKKRWGGDRYIMGCCNSNFNKNLEFLRNCLHKVWAVTPSEVLFFIWMFFFPRKVLESEGVSGLFQGQII